MDITTLTVRDVNGVTTTRVSTLKKNYRRDIVYNIMVSIQLKTGREWVAMRTSGGKVYEFKNEEAALRMKDLCYPFSDNTRVKVAEVKCPK